MTVLPSHWVDLPWVFTQFPNLRKITMLTESFPSEDPEKDARVVASQCRKCMKYAYITLRVEGWLEALFGEYDIEFDNNLRARDLQVTVIRKKEGSAKIVFMPAVFDKVAETIVPWTEFRKSLKDENGTHSEVDG
ncbi:hypothetical protein BT63DRAFT_429631 [Microthyrium microscopicum]|uniref:Uncharacterized protein n=1 Tax=Microthyrium microscopicum TaxID=703497 RepID=A0A6A6TXB5_9PEZI|nr:hypothetical protein BT63DRAFT_429631 [Microthyrium microscopicum]